MTKIKLDNKEITYISKTTEYNFIITNEKGEELKFKVEKSIRDGSHIDFETDENYFIDGEDVTGYDLDEAFKERGFDYSDVEVFINDRTCE